jgi:hypothetical protein
MRTKTRVTEAASRVNTYTYVKGVQTYNRKPHLTHRRSSCLPIYYAYEITGR